MMYFVNRDHQTNYEHLTKMIFRQAKNDPEYHAMTYLLSVPSIYERAVGDPLFSRLPFLWTVQYKDIHYSHTDEKGEEMEVSDFEVLMDDKGREVHSEAYNTLSTGYVVLVELAMNLFNGANDFNLVNALGTWDGRLMKVFHQALLLRANRNIQGLTIKFN